MNCYENDRQSRFQTGGLRLCPLSLKESKSVILVSERGTGSQMNKVSGTTQEKITAME